MRVLITGIGMLSCIGSGVAAHRQAMASGRSGIAAARDAGAMLPDDARAGFVAADGADSTDDAGARPRVWSFLQRAIDEALESAALDSLPDGPVYVGSAHGDLDGWLRERHGGSAACGLWEAGRPGSALHARRPVIVSTACTASAVALGLAFDALRAGVSGIAVVAGAEAVNSFLHAGFDSLRSLARGPCRPFDRERNGLVLGEGAAALVIETEAHASRRGARGIAELAGYGFAADAAFLTAPDPSALGAAGALRQAVAQAGLDAPPDFVNAHGTGTLLNDRMECVALRRAFGTDAQRIAITSTKPLTGHLCGASGAIEAALTAISLQHGVLPSIAGFRHPEPEFDALDFVGGSARHACFDTAISMNSGFGGTNTALAFRRLAC